MQLILFLDTSAKVWRFFLNMVQSGERCLKGYSPSDHKQVSYPDSIEILCLANTAVLSWILQVIHHHQCSLFCAPAPCFAPRDVQKAGPPQRWAGRAGAGPGWALSLLTNPGCRQGWQVSGKRAFTFASRGLREPTVCIHSTLLITKKLQEL